MKKTETPIRLFHKSVVEKWDFMKQVKYEEQVSQILRHLDNNGKECNIEYLDEYGNILETLCVD